jgi:hypothetical protein
MIMARVELPCYHLFMLQAPENRVPTHPGEMLLEEFLNPKG